MPEQEMPSHMMQQHAGRRPRFSFSPFSPRSYGDVVGQVSAWPRAFPGQVVVPGRVPYTVELPGYEYAPTPQSIAIYEHIFEASYASAFDDVRMHRVVPVFVYVDLAEEGHLPLIAMHGLALLLDAFDYDVVLEFADLEGSFLKKLFVRTRSRKTRQEVDSEAAKLVRGVAETAATDLPGFDIWVGRSRIVPSDANPARRDEAAVQKDRAETAKLKAEAWEKRGSATSHFTQALKNLMIGSSVAWYLVIDGQIVGVEPGSEAKLAPQAEEVEIESPSDLMESLLDATSARDAKKAIDQHRRRATKLSRESPAGVLKKGKVQRFVPGKVNK